MRDIKRMYFLIFQQASNILCNHNHNYINVTHFILIILTYPIVVVVVSIGMKHIYMFITIIIT